MLDIGCGDGRVCIAVRKTIGESGSSGYFVPKWILSRQEISERWYYFVRLLFFTLIAIFYPLGCRAIGVDVSPPYIAMARNVAQEENIRESKCAFFEADATVTPDILLSGKPVSNIALVIFREKRFYFPRLCMCFAAWLLTAHRNLTTHLFYYAEASPLSPVLKSSTVVFFFIYPDLLIRLLPFLSKVADGINGSTRVIATLAYHIPESNAVVECIDEVHDIKLYSKVVI